MSNFLKNKTILYWHLYCKNNCSSLKDRCARKDILLKTMFLTIIFELMLLDYHFLLIETVD